MPKGYLKIIESVPVSFIRRAGDWAQEGGNNALLVLGTDRARSGGPATIDDGLGTVDADGGGKGTGTITAVVGRKDLEGGNPDINADDASLYLSQKTAVDDNLGTSFETIDVGPAIVAKSDHLRFVFRNNLKIAATGKETHVFLDESGLHVDMQGKAKLTLDVSDSSAVVRVEAQGNTITISSDGTVTIKSNSEVTVQSKSVTIDAQETSVTGDLSVQGSVKAVGDVQAGTVSLTLHDHLLAGVKAGPDTVVSGPPVP